MLSQTSNFDTREGANNHMTGLLLFQYRHGILHLLYLKGFLLRCLNFLTYLSVSLGLRIWCGRGRLSFCSLSLASVSRCRIMAETACVSFRTLSICFPLIALSHFPLNVGFLSFLTLGYCSFLHDFVSDSEVSSSHRLINLKSYRRLQSRIARLPIVSNSLLIIHSKCSLKLNRILQFSPV